MDPQKESPREQIKELKTENRRESTLLVCAAIFIIALGAILWWLVGQDRIPRTMPVPASPRALPWSGHTYQD